MSDENDIYFEATGQETRRAVFMEGYLDMVVAQCKQGEYSTEEGERKLLALTKWLIDNPDALFSEYAHIKVVIPTEGIPPEKQNKIIEEETHSDPAIADGPCVYILASVDIPGVYKIGKANNLKKRLSAYSTHNPNPPTIVYAFYTDNPICLEAALHRAFAGKRTHGEWFALNDQDVIDAIDLGEQFIAEQSPAPAPEAQR